jgi:hypothetical protein
MGRVVSAADECGDEGCEVCYPRTCQQCFCPISDKGDRFCSDQCEWANDRQLGPDSERFTTDVAATPIDKEDA